MWHFNKYLQPPLARWPVVLAACTTLYAPASAAAPPGARLGSLVEVVDADVREDHADITVQFSCSVRYIGNSPPSRGRSTRITLRLGPDCGNLSSGVIPEFPLVGGGGDVVTGARLEPTVPGEVSLELSWVRDFDFVIAPTANSFGLRIRLLHLNQRKGSAVIYEPGAPVVYAVNLDASTAQFSQETVSAAAAALKTQAYMSQTEVEGEQWYRLRVGPFATRAEAERVLQIALSSYPHAWLAQNDEGTELAVIERAGVPSPPPNEPTDAPLTDVQRAQILIDARTALQKRLYPESVDLLTRLLRQPEFSGRADAQELMGIVRERAGQMSQAKAAYEAYLRRYPDGPGAARVRTRLQALIAGSLTPQSAAATPAAPNTGWSMVGSAALGYQAGRDETVTSGTTGSSTPFNTGLVYADVLIRDRGPRYDFIGRVDAGYTQAAASLSGGREERTTAAYAELADRSLGLTGRVGRQVLTNQGVMGLFDGAYVGYQVSPDCSVSAAGGYPVYTGYSGFSSQQQFGTVSAEYRLFHQALVLDAYALDEIDQSLTDRRSVGFQTRLLRPGVTAVMLVDYDLFFQQINAATVFANLKAGAWLFGLDLDHRRSPLLEINNALIGQTASDVRTLEATMTPLQIKQLAVDRTAQSDTFVVSANRSLGERWQVLLDLAALRLSGTRASGGVPATSSTGLDKTADLQLSGSSLVQSSDLQIFGIRLDDSPTSRSAALSWDARFAVGGAWRLGPRFTVQELNDTILGKQRLYLPEVRADWTGKRSIFEFIGGYQLEQQPAQQFQTQTGLVESSSVEQRSLYASATYRFRF